MLQYILHYVTIHPALCYNTSCVIFNTSWIMLQCILDYVTIHPVLCYNTTCIMLQYILCHISIHPGLYYNAPWFMLKYNLYYVTRHPVLCYKTSCIMMMCKVNKTVLPIHTHVHGEKGTDIHSQNIFQLDGLPIIRDGSMRTVASVK